MSWRWQGPLAKDSDTCAPEVLQCGMSLSAQASSGSSTATARTGTLMDRRFTLLPCRLTPCAALAPSAMDTCSDMKHFQPNASTDAGSPSAGLMLISVSCNKH